MTGRRKRGRRMKYNCDSNFFDLSDSEKITLVKDSIKKNSIVLITTELDASAKKRYLLKSINKKALTIDVIPLEDMFSSPNFIEKPILVYPISMIYEIIQMPREDLLFLVNHVENPHIYQAISSLL
jgi:hypothetical protein